MPSTMPAARTTGVRDQAAVREVLDSVRAAGPASLSAPEAKRVCDAYGIAVPQEGLATSPEEAVALAEEIGLPVVLKIVSPDILHKTEAGGVLVGLSSAEEVSAGFETILRNAKAYDPDADITGVQVQQMQEYRDRGIDKPIVASLAGDVEVEQASEYLFDHGIPAYPYTTETPVEVLAAKYRWARLAGFIDGQPS